MDNFGKILNLVFCLSFFGVNALFCKLINLPVTFDIEVSTNVCVIHVYCRVSDLAFVALN